MGPEGLGRGSQLEAKQCEDTELDTPPPGPPARAPSADPRPSAGPAQRGAGHSPLPFFPALLSQWDWALLGALNVNSPPLPQPQPALTLGCPCFPPPSLDQACGGWASLGLVFGSGALSVKFIFKVGTDY